MLSVPFLNAPSRQYRAHRGQEDVPDGGTRYRFLPMEDFAQGFTLA
jgi:hypothetical protein